LNHDDVFAGFRENLGELQVFSVGLANSIDICQELNLRSALIVIFWLLTISVELRRVHIYITLLKILGLRRF